MVSVVARAVVLSMAASAVVGFAPSGFRPSRASVGNTPTSLNMGLGDSLKSFLGLGGQVYPEPCVMGDESIMSKKAHGTSETPVQENLRWEADRETADRICNFNRHYAEYRGYWTSTTFVKEAKEEYDETGEIKFYDSNTGKPLFVAPKGRTFKEFIEESLSHGWPSFRDEEVIWDNVRCLQDGEAVSADGTHLGHNLPDATGSRYCINLVSVAGKPGKEG
uniref:Uncharacterized protein n=1 Tax=Trieres chinensis TaxID=1514140 RepID=A0A7S2EW94_TRICV|mmetsp:Transcript_4456/g.9424  ORF Transcript_4456/g.9424 Transcript_4456/m.9424 type:complete len:221 (+) Transcript_4456:62-724(+)